MIQIIIMCILHFLKQSSKEEKCFINIQFNLFFIIFNVFSIFFLKQATYIRYLVDNHPRLIYYISSDPLCCNPLPDRNLDISSNMQQMFRKRKYISIILRCSGLENVANGEVTNYAESFQNSKLGIISLFYPFPTYNKSATGDFVNILAIKWKNLYK